MPASSGTGTPTLSWRELFFDIAFLGARAQYTPVIFLRNYFINTTEEIDVLSVIHEVTRTLRESTIPDGLVTVIVPGPGGALTIVEPLPDVLDRLKEALGQFPGEGTQTVNRRKEEIPVGPRISAAMLGKSVQIPVSAGKFVLGPREEVVLIDFEREGRRREFTVQVMGEAPQQQQQQQGRGPAPRRR